MSGLTMRVWCPLAVLLAGCAGPQHKGPPPVWESQELAAKRAGSEMGDGRLEGAWAAAPVGQTNLAKQQLPISPEQRSNGTVQPVNELVQHSNTFAMNHL